ncbi:MAG: flagellar hook-basal body complex protein FliE [Caldicoprobacter oshimai]|uniref:Flagellar hook-basal body complex protein FliE n=1 Tax=Caldicoprobacter faecalis TaxID=937334 RepID=A0A1I5RL36_9FIRM|nr:flagellar hook-basal body complex protein FliE [Caldicoprobacter faecalis]PZN11204.1 MAG: flagellar hook-basal body complex protein FliE [Caldicoprobacter oshimai]SFP59203.1 flagellar hook-basal body complex protein FliE [Caldicoprobacter faecalis]
MQIGSIAPSKHISGISSGIRKQEQGLSFGDVLKQAISDLQQLQRTSAYNNYLLATGQVENLHKVMIDAEKADIALQFTLQIRNKLLEAYQEIMRMQI